VNAALDPIREAVEAQDAQLLSHGLRIWIGGEPTFTLRSSQEPAWLCNAEGSDKTERARALLLALMPRLSPTAVLFRSAGRRYPGEDGPRFCFGTYFKRNGALVWDGPPDPLLAAPSPAPPCGPDELRDALTDELRIRGAAPIAFSGPDGEPRLAYWRMGGAADHEELRMRRSPHTQGRDAPAFDEAALKGLFVLAVHAGSPLEVELPGYPLVRDLVAALGALAAAAKRLKMPTLVLSGFPPPVDESVAWLTVTPDPGVVEVNLAPAPHLATFLDWSRAVFAAAEEVGLSPERFRFNGQAADSGGGGQLTFGGPSPAESPFVVFPHLLPGLVRAAAQHPSLSYWFSNDCVGGASQGPRADEGVRERFEELAVALDRLDLGDPSPGMLWESLAPLLVDSAGNPHRAEINIEKLWNPTLPGRGRLGLVELRALRMQRAPERLVAIAALFRALLARLATDPLRTPLADWGRELHDRFALPLLLQVDLREVLAELSAHGFGLGSLEALLLEPPRPLACVECGAASLEISPALEFWPLLGDVASQEGQGARLVDSSTARLQLCVRAPDGDPGIIAAQGWAVPLQVVDAQRYVAGVRYRAFAPRPGLHPGLEPHDPLLVTWSRGDEAVSIALYEWIPAGGAYAGLPQDAMEAALRCADRVVVRRDPPKAPPREVPAQHRTRYCVDLRRLPCTETRGTM
jgi:uncharacterized protein (DUF2126 family)